MLLLFGLCTSFNLRMSHNVVVEEKLVQCNKHLFVIVLVI